VVGPGGPKRLERFAQRDPGGGRVPPRDDDVVAERARQRETRGLAERLRVLAG
jgi:hypothetical protein